MKKKFLYTALFAMILASCSEQELIEQPSTPVGGTEVQLPADVTSGELLIKFDPQMTDILDRTLKVTTRSGGAMTRSGIPSTDEVLDILGAYHFERIFPVDVKNEERTRSAGLHLWYRVKFDENTDLKEAASRLAKLGEISKVQANGHIKRAYNTKGYRSYISEAALQQKSATRAVTASGRFSDPGLPYQWHYINSGTNEFDNKNGLNNGSEAGCDVGCTEAWKKCTGDPAIIVAVLDEGVMHSHPDLRDNMWMNEGEELYADTDKDGNGYKDVRKENARMKNNNFLRIPINRIIALILLDIMSIIVASVGALYIRFDFNFSSIPVGYFEKLENIIAFNIIVTLVFFALWKLYKSVWRYASATELLNIIFATTCAAIAQVILCYILDEKMPRSYYVIYWALLFAMTSAIRFSYRILRLINSKRTEFTGRKKIM